MSPEELRQARAALADTVERFARSEIAPHMTAWDAAGEFPRALYRRAGELGLLGLGYPEQYGGTPASQRLRLTMWVAARADAGDSGADWVGEVCVLKNHATQALQFCADAGVQLLGGMGYMRGTVCERIYREVKALTIGGGSEEIMKELAARQWHI